MKRLLSLLLCGVMLMTLCVGCKKEETTAEPLTDTRIVSDLTKNNYLYTYAHAEGVPTISNFSVVSRDEKEDAANLSVTAVATNDYVQVELAADMEYVREHGYWRLVNITLTDSNATIVGAPNVDSIKQTLSNYVSIVGSALAIMGEERHSLQFNVGALSMESKWIDGSTTATLGVSLTSDKLTFIGSYNLTFGEDGWVIESEKQEDGHLYPVLHLTALEQKAEEAK